ncbi:ATP-grasp domain-containing protein [Chitinophagaceae bacterium MMS25-I14]
MSTPTLAEDIFELNESLCVATTITHFSLYDFDFRRYFDCRSVFSENSLPAVLRIGAIKNYETLYNDFNNSGVKLINSVEEHNRASLLPHWYPLIQELTPRSKWYDELPAIAEVGKDFGWPVFIKGERQTNRHKRSLSIAENEADLERILQAWQADPVLHWQKMICREFVALEKVGDVEGDNIQVSKEFRVFTWKNKVAGIGPYWQTERKIQLTAKDATAITKLAETVAEIVDVPFLVVDIAQQTNGKWIVIELNDAQESGYAGVSKLKLWENIISFSKYGI